ncbi:MAG TPA: ATP-dependent helicase [Candidatus Blautia merdavium]|uniref:DNA 3'-5' helicase n=1 Tax=Candidatus Blautia merdavium TaxID=2838494 RepID=A0A9D2PPF9_9FIRM|nr:ATP-dependent helicase [Candidatus Blautia merdavium]
MERNLAQEKAVCHNQGPMMLLAGPGSGKTTTMTRRVVHLITECRVNPAHILVVTFTKAAAREMRERFWKLCALSGVRSNYSLVTFGTFHGIFYGILKAAYGLTGKNILSEDKKYELLKEIVYKEQVDTEDERELFEGLVQEISEVKNARIPLEHYYSRNCPDEVFRRIYTAYVSACRRARLLDFDDMLLYCYDLLDQRPDILAGWREKFQYILVDEFQDINKLQYDIVKMLAAPRNNLFIVGDDDQSIYAFRGAKPEIMMHFPKDFPKVHTEILSCNYRSTEEIVEAAGKVISFNQRRFKKKIHANKEKGMPPVVKIFEKEKEEEQYVRECIRRYAQSGTPYEEMAVLYRTNSGAGFLVEKLMEYQIPFQMRDILPNLYEHWISRNMISYMKLAKGDRSRREFLQVMNRPNRYISRAALEEPTVSFEALRWHYEGKEWLLDRIDKLEEDLGKIREMTPYGAINYIRYGVGYDEYLKDYASYRKLKVQDLYEVLEELADQAKGYKTFDEWFAHIREYTESLKEQAKKQSAEKKGVVISTLHSIKGLEFDKVFIMDVNEGSIPYHKAVSESDIEEERRLFYVGMTRAREELQLLLVKERHEKRLEPSRFLRESGLLPDSGRQKGEQAAVEIFGR